MLNTIALVRVDSDGAAILGKGLVPAPARPQIGSVAIPDEGMGEGVTAALGSSQRLLQNLLVPGHSTFQRLHPREAAISPIVPPGERGRGVTLTYPRLSPREARKLPHGLVASSCGIFRSSLRGS